MNLTTDIFTKFDREWALLTAGTVDDHNAMTVSWGGMGTLWNKPVVTVYVRPSRHTMKYMEENDFFTLSFFGEEYRSALMLMGTKSGRDIDKDAAAGLTAKAVEKGYAKSVGYEGAKLTILCEKLYYNDMDPDKIPEVVKFSQYKNEDWHRMYIAEVIDIIEE